MFCAKPEIFPVAAILCWNVSCIWKGLPQHTSYFKFLCRQLFHTHTTLWLIRSYITWLPSCMLYVQSTLRELRAGLALQIGPCCSCIWICGLQLDNWLFISSPCDPFSSRAASKENKFYFCFVSRVIQSLFLPSSCLCARFSFLSYSFSDWDTSHCDSELKYRVVAILLLFDAV